MSAALGGTQSLHTNSFDEALGLPTEESALIALRTQQVLAHESGVASTVDPLAGSYYVESLTDRIEAEALVLIGKVDELGGAVAAIEAGFPQREIEESAYAYARGIEEGRITVVGVNDHVTDHDGATEVTVVDPDLERSQIESLRLRRSMRDTDAVASRLEAVTVVAARSDENLLYPMKEALVAGASVGDITTALLPVFGRYRPSF